MAMGGGWHSTIMASTVRRCNSPTISWHAGRDSTLFKLYVCCAWNKWYLRCTKDVIGTTFTF